jgi:hypothetical protein
MSINMIQGKKDEDKNWWNIVDPNFEFIPILRNDNHFETLIRGCVVKNNNDDENDLSGKKCKNNCEHQLIEIRARKNNSIDSKMVEGVYKHSFDQVNNVCIWDRIQVDRFLIFNNGWKVVLQMDIFGNKDSETL